MTSLEWTLRALRMVEIVEDLMRTKPSSLGKDPVESHSLQSCCGGCSPVEIGWTKNYPTARLGWLGSQRPGSSRVSGGCRLKCVFVRDCLVAGGAPELVAVVDLEIVRATDAANLRWQLGLGR